MNADTILPKINANKSSTLSFWDGDVEEFVQDARYTFPGWAQAASREKRAFFYDESTGAEVVLRGASIREVLEIVASHRESIYGI